MSIMSIYLKIDLFDKLGYKTNGIFEFNEGIYEDEQEAIQDAIENQYALFSMMMNMIAENAYISIEQMKAVKQNAVQKVEIETLSTQKKLPEDVQNIISGFARSEIKGGRKSKKRGLNKKRKSIKKRRSK